jgi:hypothetical protein
MLFLFRYFSKKFEIITFVGLTWALIFLKNFIFYKYLDLNLVHGGGNKIIGDFNQIFEFISIFSFGLIISIIKYKIWIFIFISFYFFSTTKLLSNNEKFFNKFFKVNLILFLLLLIGIYYNLYINSSLDFKWWIDTTLDRLIYSYSGIFVIMIMLTINNIKNYNLK